MPRYLFTLLLVMAVALFGVNQHVATAGEPQNASAPCHDGMTVKTEQASAAGHCGESDHAMSGACASACLGSIAIWFTSEDLTPLTFRPSVHWSESTLFPVGRTGKTAERPPKSL